MRLLPLLLLAILTPAMDVFAQSATQLWVEQMYGIRIHSQAVLNINPTISAITYHNGWWSVDVYPNVEYAVTPNVDIHGAILLSYTKTASDFRCG